MRRRTFVWLRLSDTGAVEVLKKSDVLLQRAERARIQFLVIEIQATWALIGLAEVEQQIGNQEEATRSRRHAEQGYATIVRFLNDAKHMPRMPRAEFLRMRAETRRIRKALDDLSGT